jgi:hypothetical protein
VPIRVRQRHRRSARHKVDGCSRQAIDHTLIQLSMIVCGKSGEYVCRC